VSGRSQAAPGRLRFLLASPLDTMVLAMPISWKGTLQQYAGRQPREHASKQDVRIDYYIEHDNVQLARMWEKHCRGYQTIGYRVRQRHA